MNKAAKIKAKDLTTQYKVLKTSLLAMGEEALKTVFEVSPKIKEVVIRGYTPSFNDGEPCEHVQLDNFSINGYFTEGYSFDEDEENEKECPISEAELALVVGLVNSDMVFTFLKDKYGTNFELTIKLDKESKLSISQEHYYDE